MAENVSSPKNAQPIESSKSVESKEMKICVISEDNGKTWSVELKAEEAKAEGQAGGATKRRRNRRSKSKSAKRNKRTKKMY